MCLSGKESSCRCRRLRSCGLGRPPGGGNVSPLCILAWKIPWTEEPGRVQSMGSQSWTWLSRRTHYTLNYLLIYPFSSFFKWRTISRMQLDEFLYRHTHPLITTNHVDQDRKHFQHPRSPFTPQSHFRSLPLWSNYYCDLYHHRLVLLVSEVYVNRITR